jgi:hypothetical protein
MFEVLKNVPSARPFVQLIKWDIFRAVDNNLLKEAWINHETTDPRIKACNIGYATQYSDIWTEVG